ncbi:MAG: imidazole glycerol phosphate synthase subunit HisH [Candidatus Latescibacteria bacterium]|nr:imidazole glycerol phosphate synthase subunit HisH [Candidatus Latescibacterota bacterium]
MITIVDYGMGNAGSLQNMIRKAGGESRISANREEIAKASKLILPGVGSFDNGITKLNETGILDILHIKVIQDKTPILCICLGMQMITRQSEEGKMPGLGWINAKTIRFKFTKESNLRIPHMGWNTVKIKKNTPLFYDMHQEPRFYFVHSFYVVCEDKDDIVTTTDYGLEFVSSLQRDNIFATQFHPEKSHLYGIKLIHNFIAM